MRFAEAPKLLPGVAAAAALAAAATAVSNLHGGPQMLYALLFGVALHSLARRSRMQPGVSFASSTLLRLGVGLLGAHITATQIVALGWPSALVVVLAVLSTLAFAQWAGARLGMSRAQSALAGGSVAICGASAALAIAAVLPRNKDSERFTLIVVVAVTLLSTLVMVLYPVLVRLLGLPPALAGLFLGATIHDVAQVVGAGYTIDTQTGDTATIVKLFRVTLLAVVVAGTAWVFRAERAEQAANNAPGQVPERQALLPWFLWLFIAMVVLNSLGGLPTSVQTTLEWTSRTCLVVAIAALGMKTSFTQLAHMGWQPVALIVAETVWLALFVLVAVLAMR